MKRQNLLLQPATATEVADGHPLGVPILKVADFGFARILPAAAMAETLCGSPYVIIRSLSLADLDRLYMAPEILRYEKYDAKADLWSVGAVLFEMSVDKPPFRANNHVELLRKIEKGEDRIKFPDESSRASEEAIPPSPVSPDIKALIRGLLKRQPVQRMSFDEFFQCGVWDGYMTESTEGGSLSLEVSTDSSAANLAASDRVREMLESVDRSIDKILPRKAPQPISTDLVLNPLPAKHEEKSATPSPLPTPNAQPSKHPKRRSEPKYYVSDDSPSIPSPTAATLVSPIPLAPPIASTATIPAAAPRPIQTPAQRRFSSREKEPASIEEAQPVTPTSLNAPPPPSNSSRSGRVVSEGSPLAATPPMTMARDEEVTGKNSSALDASDSMVNREYVVVEKRTVEINALADGQSSRICQLLPADFKQSSTRRRNDRPLSSTDQALASALFRGRCPPSNRLRALLLHSRPPLSPCPTLLPSRCHQHLHSLFHQQLVNHRLHI